MNQIIFTLNCIVWERPAPPGAAFEARQSPLYCAPIMPVPLLHPAPRHAALAAGAARVRAAAYAGRAMPAPIPTTDAVAIAAAIITTKTKG